MSLPFRPDRRLAAIAPPGCTAAFDDQAHGLRSAAGFVFEPLHDPAAQTATIHAAGLALAAIAATRWPLPRRDRPAGRRARAIRRALGGGGTA